MAQSFIYDNFNITTSLNANSVYMKVVNKVTFQNYEGNIDKKTLKMAFSITETYQLIIGAIQKSDTNFTVEFAVHRDILEMNFHMLLHNILNIEFKILLKEKIISGNKEATMLLNNIEENFNNEIKKLKIENIEMKNKYNELLKIIENVSFAEVGLCLYHSHSSGYNYYELSFPINIAEIVIKYDITEPVSGYRFTKFYDKKLNLFHKLKKITFEYYNYHDFMNISNKYIEELYIKPYSTSTSSYPNKINGIENFPSLKVLHIERCTNLNDVYNTLSKIKHNIKQMTFIGCSSIDQQNLKLYCEQNKIHLQIS